MRTSLLIAAGGGGDAIAAAMLHRALAPDARRPAVATYSWDRLLIDPTPGPRDPSGFTQLEPLGEHNYRLTANSTARPPGASTLPRLAAQLDADLYLLDPRGGARGLADQLDELLRQLNAATVSIVDVGGDILAHGDEPTLRSPLADSLVLAASAALGDAVELLVTGAGIDGELPEALVRERYGQLHARQMHHLSPADAKPFQPHFAWHPSEATGLLCAAAAGARGTAEIRDRGFPVTLTDHTPDVHALPARTALEVNRIAAALIPTSSLAEVEAAIRAVGRDSEIDYERRKAERQDLSRPAALDPSDLDARLDRIRSEAVGRGADFITLRGLAERLRLGGDQLGDLQRQLQLRTPSDYTPPLWHLRPAAAAEGRHRRPPVRLP